MSLNESNSIHESGVKRNVGNLWQRYSRLTIIISILTLLLISIWLGYEYWVKKENEKTGVAFIEAAKLSSDDKLNEALAAFNALSTKNNGSYSTLTRMYIASILARKGEIQNSVEKFIEIANDSSIPATVRDIARLHAGWLLINTSTYDQVATTIKKLDIPNNPLRHSAKEALGLAAIKAGDFKTAKKLFQEAIKDTSMPPGIANRIQMILSNMESSDK